jgi:hypothetical protein
VVSERRSGVERAKEIKAKAILSVCTRYDISSLRRLVQLGTIVISMFGSCLERSCCVSWKLEA